MQSLEPELPPRPTIWGRVAPLFEGDELSPLRRSGWLVFYSYHAALVGSYREGFEALGMRGSASGRLVMADAPGELIGRRRTSEPDPRGAA